MSGAEFIPDEAVQAAMDGYAAVPSMNHTPERMAAALAAALPHMNIPDEAAIRAEERRRVLVEAADLHLTSSRSHRTPTG